MDERSVSVIATLDRCLGRRARLLSEASMLHTTPSNAHRPEIDLMYTMIEDNADQGCMHSALPPIAPSHHHVCTVLHLSYSHHQFTTRRMNRICVERFDEDKVNVRANEMFRRS